ncbi:hypothetical protein Pcinc_024034 [Petrolisthes cinctipes]|uniref:Uncharacterized protein n=1 Tax=Petrolisthes cinctipes TaxID=88211 RepID=A0AAE1KBC1_PETCI|nr:hypothetical protein Pcinc_024034 [Petrolisthes cinctipes]
MDRQGWYGSLDKAMGKNDNMEEDGKNRMRRKNNTDQGRKEGEARVGWKSGENDRERTQESPGRLETIPSLRGGGPPVDTKKGSEGEREESMCVRGGDGLGRRDWLVGWLVGL